jgi:hypothetical protein
MFRAALARENFAVPGAYKKNLDEIQNKHFSLGFTE